MKILKKYTQDNKAKGKTGTYGPAGDADPDQLTFGEAFADAKRAGVKKFKWKSKWYTTETKDEKKSKYDTPKNRKKMGEMKKEWEERVERRIFEFDAKGKKKVTRKLPLSEPYKYDTPKVIRKYDDGGVNGDNNEEDPLKEETNGNDKPTPKKSSIQLKDQKIGTTNVQLKKDDPKKIGTTNVQLPKEKKTVEEKLPEGFGVAAAKKAVAKKKSDVNASDLSQKKDDVTKSDLEGGTDIEDPVIRPSERETRRANTSPKRLARLEQKERERAIKNREKEQERMDRMSEREKRKYARQTARQERKRERQQMRQQRKEQRQYRRTMRRKSREERREDRGMTYTGGRRISPRRWYKNLRDKLGLRVKRGSGRLKSYDEFKTSNTNPAYYQTEEGKTLSRRSRRGRIRSGKGSWGHKRGSVDRYKQGGFASDHGEDKGFTMLKEGGKIKKGKNTKKYQYGGVRTINKEGREHGASKEQMDYAKGLYKGASKGQKKQAMGMYKQYKKTGEIPEGAEDLYESAGGDDRYFDEGGTTKKAPRKEKKRNWVQKAGERWTSFKAGRKKHKPYTKDQWHKGAYGHTREGYKVHPGTPEYRKFSTTVRHQENLKRQKPEKWNKDKEEYLKYAKAMQAAAIKGDKSSYDVHRENQDMKRSRAKTKREQDKRRFAKEDAEARKQRITDAKESSLKRSKNMKFGPKYALGGNPQVRQVKNQRFADKENQRIQQHSEKKDLRKEQKAQRIEGKAEFRADKQRAKQTGALDTSSVGSGSVGLSESSFKRGGKVSLARRKRSLKSRSKNPGRKAFMGMVAKAAGSMMGK